VGCNILLSAFPQDAKVDAVRDGAAIPPTDVRRTWQAFSFLRDATPESRGWTTDVLSCVREIQKPVFSLDELYSFEKRLGKMHRENRNVRPKIRQQLQILRGRGVIEFLGRGEYRVLLVPGTT